MTIFASGGYNLLRVRFLSAVILILSIALEVSAESLPDFDGNGVVDIPDFLLFVDHFGARRGDETYEERYDLDSDGEISVSDFLIFIDHFGKSAPDASEEDLVLMSLEVTGGIGEIYPAFDSDVRHYAVRCEDATKLQVMARAKDEKAQLKLNNNQMSGRDVDEAVVVDSDHDIAIEVSDGQCSVTYVVHCIPPDFPEVSVVKKQAGVSDGLMFMNLGIKGVNPPFFMVVMDNNGVPRFHRRFSSRRSHFQRHTTGPTIDGRQVHYSVAKQVPEAPFSFISEVELLDESFELIKTVEPLPPVMQATSHDFLITDEGNFMFMAYSPAQRDFGVHGVHDTTDPVIQEVTPMGEEVYRWVGFDHLTIDPDCLWSQFERDYAHINSIQVTEEDIIASFRGCAQVLRIDRSAKSEDNPGTRIVWQLGGTDQGESFPDDRVFLSIEGDDDGRGEFCSQHQPTLTDAGTLVLFDNGSDCLSARIGGSSNRSDLQPFSRVVEYAIDPLNGRASFIRQFRLEPKYGYTPWWGGVTVLDNGNWLIAWRNDRDYDKSLGIEERAVALSEVDATGTEVFRLNAYSGDTYWATYRAYREPEAEIKIPLNLP